MHRPRRPLAVLGVCAALLLSACGGEDRGSGTPVPVPPDPVLTPVVGSVLFAPTPFAGSDGSAHLVYEVSLTDFMRTPVTITGVKTLDAGAAGTP